MRIAGIYSFKSGQEVVERDYSRELDEIRSIIKAIRSEIYLTKVSREKTMPGELLYSPRALNAAFKQMFSAHGWRDHRIACEYSTEEYTDDYKPSFERQITAFREIDFVKNQLGVEVQFGKYAFMVYNVCAKMTIFHNRGVIRAGVEIVPVKEMAENMSSGVSYFEQIV